LSLGRVKKKREKERKCPQGESGRRREVGKKLKKTFKGGRNRRGKGGVSNLVRGVWACNQFEKVDT